MRAFRTRRNSTAITLGPNLAAICGPLGLNMAAIFGPRTKYSCQIWSLGQFLGRTIFAMTILAIGSWLRHARVRVTTPTVPVWNWYGMEVETCCVLKYVDSVLQAPPPPGIPQLVLPSGRLQCASKCASVKRLRGIGVGSRLSASVSTDLPSGWRIERQSAKS